MTDGQLRQLLEDVQCLKDRQAILDVIMRHARGHDRHDAGDLSYARPLQLDSPSLLWDGKTP